MHDVAWRGMWICVRSKDAQKQLARTSLRCLTWEFNDGCSQRMCMASLIFNWKLVEAESRIFIIIIIIIIIIY